MGSRLSMGSCRLRGRVERGGTMSGRGECMMPWSGVDMDGRGPRDLEYGM